MIRQACMDYIESEKEFFVQFIIGGEGSFEDYVERKRHDGVWGDDIELQAMSEIYNRPIEIFAYRVEPMRTFHEDQHKSRDVRPIKLSYHGNEHYNSVVEINPSRSENKQ
jgi:OTU domain-containing protein 5